MFYALWYVAKVAMSPFWRILVSVLVLTALVPTAFGRSNIICVESSGRVSYVCNDVVPDEVAARFAVSVQFGPYSEDCGFCHDSVVGQAIPQAFQHLALPVALIGAHRLVLPQRVSMVQDQSFPVAFVESSGSISPLKC